MSSKEKDLREILQRLEASTRKLINTRGYSRDAKGLKLLEEMIREQLTDANTHHSTRTIR